MKWFPSGLRCSFCRRHEREIAKLVAGRRVYICDACVTAAQAILDSGPSDPTSARAPGRTERLLDRLRWFRGGRGSRLERSPVTR